MSKKIPDGPPRIKWVSEPDRYGERQFEWVSFPDSMRHRDFILESGDWRVISLLYPAVDSSAGHKTFLCPGNDRSLDFAFCFWVEPKAVLEDLVERLRKMWLSEPGHGVWELARLLGMTDD